MSQEEQERMVASLLENQNGNGGVTFVKIMTDEQLETLRKQIMVYATISEQLVEMHKNLTSQYNLSGLSSVFLFLRFSSICFTFSFFLLKKNILFFCFQNKKNLHFDKYKIFDIDFLFYYHLLFFIIRVLFVFLYVFNFMLSIFYLT